MPKIQYTGPDSGNNPYGIVWNTEGQAFNISSNEFEDYQTANRDDYALWLTELGTASRRYVGEFPGDIASGVYLVDVYDASGTGTGTTSETDTLVGIGEYQWDGTTIVPLSSRLAPTVAGRTLDVSANGNAGIDWANVENGGSVTNLTSTTVGTVNTVSNVDNVSNPVSTDLRASGFIALQGTVTSASTTTVTVTSLGPQAESGSRLVGCSISVRSIDIDIYRSGDLRTITSVTENTSTSYTFTVDRAWNVTPTTDDEVLVWVVATIPTPEQILAGGDIDGYSLEETLKLCLAALSGKLSGAASTIVTIRAADDSKDRITATVDSNGNRSAITLDATG